MCPQIDSLRILVDADACPRAVKEILYRAAARTAVPLILVSGLELKAPAGPARLEIVKVAGGVDAADDRIVELVRPGDLVVTADIPLADRVVGRGAVALDPRGDWYSEETVKERLAYRNLSDQLRGQGATLGGPPALSRRDLQAFANRLDAFLARR